MLYENFATKAGGRGGGEELRGPFLLFDTLWIEA
jgi:hypothetical protein